MNLSVDPIAVIGMGCRFPGANNPNAFWQLLQNGVDAITEVPSDRWNADAFYDAKPGIPGKMNTRWGGFLEQIDQFDPSFFGIAPREAEHMDPQQRLVLEVAWEALEDAGIAPTQLGGSKTGVFVGVGTYDYHKIITRKVSKVGAYSGLGTSNCITASRVAYLLDLKGPSLSIDTGCSSSLVAIHYACQSLRLGEANLCLVGGVNVMLSPEITVTFSQARMMASDGRCKTFDAAADGYVRGEGCGMVVLKRLADAQRDGDRILAIIAGSAINQDGLTNGITAPNGLSQQALIREAIANAGYQPADISYVETHGTGTPLGDPLEFNALKAVLMEGRSPEQRCWLGSVKTNIGHLEAAAGIASLIKVVLALGEKTIPPHLHLNQLNPYISLEGTSLAIPTTCKDWPSQDWPSQDWPSQTQTRLAGISGFSFGGTNCHLVIAEAPSSLDQKSAPCSSNPPLSSPHLLALSAKSDEALRALAARYHHDLETHPNHRLSDICFTANTGRAHFKHRLGIVTDSVADLHEQLHAFLQGQTAPTLQYQSMTRKRAPKTAFLFTGQGSQYVNMGRQLYETEPQFRACLERCNDILKPYLVGQSLLGILYPEPNQCVDLEISTVSQINQTQYTQPALFALEYALADLWMAWGITPDFVMGHSLGEYVAACVAGVFSLEDGLRLVAERAKLMGELPSLGKMVAVFATEEQVKEAIAPYAESVAIAAINGPTNIVISGISDAVDAVTSQFDQSGIKVRPLQVSHAFHSPLMEPMLDALGEVIQTINLHPPRIPLVSNLTGEFVAKDTILDKRYWQQHTRGTVRYTASLAYLVEQKCKVFLEIGPHPVLCRQGKRSGLEPTTVWLPSLTQNQGDRASMLTSLAALYTQGFDVNWPVIGITGDRQKIALPTYPFQRQRYWIQAANPDQSSAYLSNTLPLEEEMYLSNSTRGQITRNGSHNEAIESHVICDRADSIDKYLNSNGHHITTSSLATLMPAPTLANRPSDILNSLQQKLANLLLINPKNLDVNIPLLELGADSISLLDIIHDIEKNYGVTLSINTLFEISSLTELASYLDETLTDLGNPDLSQAKSVVAQAQLPHQHGTVSPAKGTPAVDAVAAIQAIAQSSSQVQHQGSPEMTTLMQQQLNSLVQVIMEQLQVLKNQSNATERPTLNSTFGSNLSAAQNPDSAFVHSIESTPQLLTGKEPSVTLTGPRTTTTSTIIQPIDRNQPLLLSHGQERLWFIHQLEGPSAAYNIPVALKLVGALNLEAFEQSIQAVIDRHESLRTTFTTVEGQPRQVIQDKIDWALSIVDLQAIPSTQQSDRIQQLVQSEIATLFNLEKAPLFRFTLLKLAPKSHVLLVTIHHIIADAWSLARVFIEEIRIGYEARCTGVEAALPALPVQYADFAHWHRQWLQGDEGQRQMAYWIQQLANAPACLDLPSDRPRPKIKSYQGDVVHQTLSPELIAQLTALNKASGTTLFMSLLAAYSILLYRYSGQTDVLIGSPMVNRPSPELKPLIGFFLNTIVLRAYLSGQPSFKEVLQRIRRMSLDAFQHPDVPFEQLLQALNLSRDSSHTPLFQAMFVLQNVAEEAPKLHQLELSPLEVNVKVAKFDLTLWLNETNGQLRAEWEYSTDLFDRTTIERMASQFEQLLQSIVTDASQPIATLSLLPVSEQRCLAQWEKGQGEQGQGDEVNPIPTQDIARAIHQQIEAQARRSPNSIAVTDGTQSLTYATLDQRANQIAHYLLSLSPQTEQRIGLCLDRSLELIVAILGILKAGLAYVPLDPQYPQERLDYIVADADLRIIITTESLQTRFRLMDAATTSPITVLALDREQATIAAQPTTAVSVEVTPHQLAYVIYTSGSTGQPKGVLIEQGSLINFVRGAIAEYGIGASDRVLQFASISFDAAAEEIYPVLSQGGTLVLRSEEMISSPTRFWEQCRAMDITVLDLPTAYWQQLVIAMAQATAAQATAALPERLKLVIIGGEKVSPEQVWQWHQQVGDRIRLLNTYGPTEATVVATIYQIPAPLNFSDLTTSDLTTSDLTTSDLTTAEQPRWLQEIPIGRPLPGIEIYVLDELCQRVPIGVPGELYLGGAGLARGYLNRPDLTAQAFVAHPFKPNSEARLYRTGDRVRYLVDGNLEYLGRIDQQVKIRGFRIELGEVEAAIKAYPEVADAIAIAREDEPGQKRLVTYIIAKANQTVSIPDLRSAIQQQLPDYMVPSAFVILDSFPLTPNGKLDRKALPIPVSEDLRQGQAYVAPRTPTEAALTFMVADVLKLKRVGITDNFFEIGGHSLLAAQVVTRIQELFQVELPLRSLFANPTVAGIAAFITSQTHPTNSTPVPQDHPTTPHSPTPHSPTTSHSPTSHSLTAKPSIPIADRSQPLPLSYAQQRMWLLTQLEGQQSAYIMLNTIEMTGRLDSVALEASFQSISQRHESLRTTFGLHEGQPVQRIQSTLTDYFARVDLRSLPAEAQAKEVEDHIRQAIDTPFDLEQGPLLRITLLQQAEQSHQLIIAVHHLIADGWSGAVFIQEMITAYQALTQGRAIPLPALSVQYADFSQWQRQQLQGDVLESHLSYWKGQLADAPPLLDLPTDRPRPAIQTVKGVTYQHQLPAGLSAQLQDLSRQSGSTLFMTLLAAFNVLLYRYSGQADIVVGSTIANRQRRELESLIGLFLNTLALRTDLSGNPTVTDLLQRVQQVSLDAYAHQDVPFECLIEQLQPERNLSHSLWFQVMFILQNTPQQVLEVPDLTFNFLHRDRGIAKFDLTVSVQDLNTGLLADWEYNSDLFDASTIERMAEHFQVVLEAMVANPNQRIADISLLTATERSLLLQTWHRTEGQALPTAPAAIHQLFEAQVTRMPEAIALECGEEKLSYQTLNQRANQLAYYLINQGVQSEELIGVCLTRSPDMIIAILAILKAGAAYVPLDPSYPQARLDYIGQDAQLAKIITTQTLASQWAASSSFTYQFVCLDQLFAQPESIHYPPTNPSIAVSPNHLAYVIYTSGSTGNPKGVLIEHRSLVNFVQGAIATYDFSAQDRVLQFASLSFDAAAEEIYPTLSCGGTLVLRSQEMLGDAVQFLQHCQALRLTVLDLPTAFWQQLILDPMVQSTFPASIRLVILGGEKVSPEAVRHWQRLWQSHSQPAPRLLNTYGPTEATVVATHYTLPQDPSQPLPSTEVPIGRPLPNVSVYVLDAQGQPVPIGVPGELHLGGLGLARGYLNQPERTAQQFIQVTLPESGNLRLYRTGDRVRFLSDGNLEYLGRIDDQVKIRGFRIELGEVESILEQQPEVQTAVAKVHKSETGQTVLVAYIVPQSDALAHEALAQDVLAQDALLQSVNTGQILTRLRERLPQYMVPSHLIPLATLPLTPNGKVDRKALPLPDLSDRLQSETRIAPRNPIEAQLATIWSDVLGISPIGVHDDFFALGGHSLGAMKVLSQVRSLFRVEVSLRQVFEQPTIASLAAQIIAQQAIATAQNPPQDSSITLDSDLATLAADPFLELGQFEIDQFEVDPFDIPAIDRTSPLPLSFAQQRLWFLAQLEGPSATYNLPLNLAIDGQLDLEALEQSFQAILQRHEALRTRFESTPQGPVQIIQSEVDWSFEVDDLSQDNAEMRSQRLEAEQQAMAQIHFDLSQAPLLRVKVLKLADDQYRMLMTIHHIVADAWSAGVVIQEILDCYPAYRKGELPILSPLPIQYGDYSVWQQQWIKSASAQTEWTYWQQQLANVPPYLDLPSDRPRPTVQSFQGDLVRAEIPPALISRAHRVAQATGTTLYMVLLSALSIVLQRYSQADDFVIGSAIAGRNHAKLSGLIGFFINTLALRFRFEPSLSSQDFLAQVRQTTLDAYSHQQIPFEQLIDRLQLDRNLSRTPLVQVMFVLQNATDIQLEIPGLQFRSLASHSGVARFDLSLAIAQTETGWIGDWEYSTDLYDRPTIERMAAQYTVLLDQFLQALETEPNRPVHQLSLLPAAEQTLLHTWTHTEKAMPLRCAHSWFEAQVMQTPEAIALAMDDQQLTYAELDARANQLAHYLQDLGIQPDSLVGILLPRSIALIISILGIWKAGGAYIPLDPSYPQERLHYMQQDADLRWIISDLQRVESTLISPSQRLFQMDWPSVESALSRYPMHSPSSPVQPHHLAYVIYTSGSTGQPKGVMVQHTGLGNLVASQRQMMGLGVGCSLLQYASPSFDASVYEILITLCSGSKLCLGHLEQLRPGPDLIRLIQQKQITHITLTPSLLALLKPQEVPSLEAIVTAGEACPAAVAETWGQHCRLYNGYGPTEATIGVSFADCTGKQGKPTIGKPIPNTQVYLLDTEQQPVPIGAPGELHIGGMGLARGYLNRPELTAERFIDHPFIPGQRLYKTGDLARWLANGELDYLGRMDSQIKLRGFRIELGEIESVLRQHDRVNEVAVVLHRDESDRQRLVAYLVPSTNTELSPAELQAYLKARLPQFMVPSAFIPLDRLPLSPSGKLDRRALPAPQESDWRLTQVYVAPRTDLEADLAQIWSDLLGVTPVGVEENFFELGGHSLLVTQLLTQIQLQFHVELPLQSLFENLTVANLATQLNDQLTVQLTQLTDQLYPQTDADLLAKLLDEIEG